MSAEQSLENIKKEIINLNNSNSLPSESLTDLKQLNHLVEKIINDYHNQTSKATNEEYAEVLYDFQPQQEGDLALHKGEKVTVLEKMSSDWYKGKDSSNNVGVFPANYVRVLENESKESSRPLPPPPTYSATSAAATQTGGSNNSYYQQMPAQQIPVQQQQYQQPAPFPPQSTNYYQQQPQQAQPAQQAQQSQGHGQLGKIGSKLGNAFVFGAGATLGGDLVNAIF
ncbi:related to [PSI+] inducibility protein 3 [Hanseniaspora guilliermondii]|uniref:Related to [PSI+] inducibility protein 3 n=1 Tax=Hanseniaspora guilliermondii TaxID=56406 RepID=A0A1L0B1L1_9ASCO|nr:related to [PSI+] inducibility protein 3 [Hanseniaspora guilliermondii]